MSKFIVVLVALAVTAECGVAQAPRRIIAIGADGSGRDYEFGSVAGAALGPAGEIYVLDGMNKEVRVFSPAGRYLRRFGREGRGPGEFAIANRVIAVGNEMRVFDPQQQRIAAFDLEGRYLRTMSVPSGAGLINYAIPMRHGVWLGVKSTMSIDSKGISALARAAPGEREQRKKEFRRAMGAFVVAYRDGEAAVDTIFAYDPGGVFFFDRSGGPRFGFLRHSWGSSGHWAVNGDSLVAFVDATEGSVAVYRVAQGGLQRIRRGRIPISPERITPAELWSAAQKERGQRMRGIELVAPENKPAFDSIVLADDGAVWVGRTARADDADGSTTYLVIPIDGTAQRSVTFPGAIRLMAVRRQTAVGVRRTNLDIDMVEVWEIPTAGRN